MARYRSREAETEDVNERRLRRGAVKRTHIGRWAVGRDELAPGVVGDIHINPEVVERIIERGAGTGVGELIRMTGTAVNVASGGDYLESEEVVRQLGFDDTGPGDTITMPRTSIYAVELQFAWDDDQNGGTVELEINGTVRRTHPDTGTGSRFEWSATIDAEADEVLRVKVTHGGAAPQAASWDLTVAAIEPIGELSEGPAVVGFADNVTPGDDVVVTLPEDIEVGDLAIAFGVNVTFTRSVVPTLTTSADDEFTYLAQTSDYACGYRVLDGTETWIACNANTVEVDDDTLRCVVVIIRGHTAIPILTSTTGAVSPLSGSSTERLTVAFGRGVSAGGNEDLTLTGPTGFIVAADQTGLDPVAAGFGGVGDYGLAWVDVDVTAGHLHLVKVT